MKLLRFVPPSVSEFIYTVLLYPRPLRATAQFFIKRMIPPTLDVDGVELVLNRNDAVLCGALALGGYERTELDLFKSLLRPGMIVLDIGANIGLFSSAAAKVLGGDGRVVAVEPDADNCSFLRRTIELNKLQNLTVVQRAAGNTCGPTQLFICPDNKADHRIYSQGARTYRQAVPIEMTTIDALVRELQLPRIDLMKIDIQGAEAMAFEGMRQTLAANQGIILLMEFWPWGLSQAVSDPAKLLRDIRAMGFNVHEIDSDAGRLVTVTDDQVLLQRDRERHHMNLLITRGAAPDFSI